MDVVCNIIEVMILSLKLCESLLFSNISQRDYPSVLLEDKQKCKSKGVDMSWNLPTFNHDLYMFSKSFICIRSLFRIITGSSTCLWKMMFWDVWETL